MPAVAAPTAAAAAATGSPATAAAALRSLEGEADRLDLLDAPTIHSIGEGSILTYEAGKPVRDPR